jgi:hypothetical protein
MRGGDPLPRVRDIRCRARAKTGARDVQSRFAHEEFRLAHFERLPVHQACRVLNNNALTR